MEPTGPKLSFGFSKIIKKPNLVNQNGGSFQKKSNIELIESIEGSSMKISGRNPEDDAPKKLIIPMTDDQKSTPLAKLLEERNRQKFQKISIKSEEPEDKDSLPPIKQEPVDETLDQQAARELIEDLKKQTVKEETKVYELPLNPDELPLEGAQESSLDDYDRIPIGDFGKAMLRGMGWKEEKKAGEEKPFDVPVQRPKGMGLGADKVVKKQPLLIAPNQSETLEIKRHACVKVLAGKHKNLYGTIEGFDDGGGRVVVKLAIGGLKVTINEFMVQAVGKAEFAKYSKILNSEKYEEYKTNPDPAKLSQVPIKSEPGTSKPRKDPTPERRRDRSRERNHDRTRDRSRSRQKDRKRSKSRDRSRSRDRFQSSSHKGKSHRRDRSEDSSPVRKYRGRSRSRDKHAKRSSSSEDHSRKKKSSRQRKNYSSPDSRCSSENDKKHKKKTKKSKQRKRDRS